MTKRATKKARKKVATKVKEVTPSQSMLADFFHKELQDIYWAESHLIKTMPKMQKAATNKVLANNIAKHITMTKEHKKRLEKVFALLGKKPTGKKCEAIVGITKECDGILKETKSGTATRDVALIMGAQKAEHYEIGTYGGLLTLANILGYTQIARILGRTLTEEKETDLKLTAIAMEKINYDAANEMKK